MERMEVIFLLPSSRAPSMRVRLHQHPNRSEGPCGTACRTERLRNHKVPPAYSRAEENARSLYGRRDDDLLKWAGSCPDTNPFLKRAPPQKLAAWHRR